MTEEDSLARTTIGEDGDGEVERKRSKMGELVNDNVEEEEVEDIEEDGNDNDGKSTSIEDVSEEEGSVDEGKQVAVKKKTKKMIQEERRKRRERQRKKQKRDNLSLLPAWLESPIQVNVYIDKDKLQPMKELQLLHPKLLARLESVGFHHVFPLQQHVVPHILLQSKSVYHGGDVCVSAPTGSGKTLTYVIPILNSLCQRVVPRLRAVIVMPTRQLAEQTYEVFVKCAHGICEYSPVPITTALSTGQTSFAKEQALLRADEHGVGKVDILVATPGRLVDHMNQTDGFTLKFLEFFVADEADRLLMQSYHGWLSTLYKALYQSNHKQSDPTRPCVRSHNSSHGAVCKMFFSATLTRDPTVIANLRLAFPRMYLATQSAVGGVDYDDMSVISPQLKEYYVPCATHDKPLALLYLLFTLQLDRTLVFVSSVEATSRLYHLLLFYGGLTIETISSSMPAHKNKEAIKKFQRGEVTVLVCSDSMARGMDLPNVENVVSYDCPNKSQTYVHRVGRAARAGAQGTAYTIVQLSEEKEFLRKRRKVDTQTVQELKLSPEEHLNQFKDRFEIALREVKQFSAQSKKQQHMKGGRRGKGGVNKSSGSNKAIVNSKQKRKKKSNK
eukprot:m.78820 g.78820  ORF g.78820 m.78820 type:complete len:614 (-) comp11970_c0_seq2:1996-3837(-)